MKRILFLFAFCIPFSLAAQHIEVGIFAGASVYEGDVAPHNLGTHFKETHPAYGGFVRYYPHPFFNLRANVFAGKVSGDDQNHENRSRKERNLSFSSNIFEFGLTAEINVMGFQPYALDRPFSPYVFMGIAGTKFNPKAEYNGDWIKLQSLGTEGQGMEGFEAPYSLMTMSIPFGLGVKYAVNDKINIGMEFGFRKTFTDYLDDVSGNYVSYPELYNGNGELAAILGNRTGEYLGTEPIILPTGTQRGQADNDDWYYMVGITVSYNFLDNGLVGSRNRRGGRRSGCPGRF